MRGFFLFSVLYAVFAVIVLFLVRDNPVLQLFDAYYRTKDTLTALWRYLPYLGVGLAALFAFTRQYGGKGILKESAWALAGSLVFSAAFTILKTAIPSVVPFYADAFFADLDKAIHGGVDPWIWTHRFAEWITPDAMGTLYFIIWGFPAAFFPLILALTDNDTARKTRYLILHGFVWIGLGNVLALAGSSVGPVYYDRLLGGARFDDLILALKSSGIADAKIGLVQDGLWRIYAENGQAMGSGISAFPSVHNGVSALTMLYLMERSKWLAPVGVAFCAAILFSSVYIGWHYAIDGYASIALVVAAWFGLYNWSRTRRRNVAFASYNPA